MKVEGAGLHEWMKVNDTGKPSLSQSAPALRSLREAAQWNVGLFFRSTAFWTEP